MSAQITGTTGTFTQPVVKAFEAGQTILFGDMQHLNIRTGAWIDPAAIGLGPLNMNIDSQAGLQADFNGYQELNSFIQFFAQNSAQTGKAAMVQLSRMLANLLQNPEMRHLYAP